MYRGSSAVHLHTGKCPLTHPLNVSRVTSRAGTGGNSFIRRRCTRPVACFVLAKQLRPKKDLSDLLPEREEKVRIETGSEHGTEGRRACRGRL